MCARCAEWGDVFEARKWMRGVDDGERISDVFGIRVEGSSEYWVVVNQP